MASKYEIWALHEKVGNQPWKIASWFSPKFDYIGDDIPAEDYVKNVAKGMTDKRRKYKAVKYTPE